MSDPGQVGTNKPPSGVAPSGPFDCAAVEVWLAEAAENTLPSAAAEQLRAHAAGCTACQEKLTQARRGREWLIVLKQEPLEPPAGIVAKILARTSLAGESNALKKITAVSDFANHDRAKHVNVDSFRGLNAADSGIGPLNAGIGYIPEDDAVSASSFVPAWQRSSVVVLRRTLLDPRLALVAAMAFFSISLTLNLLGVRLTSLHAANLAPGNMHRAIIRQYAEANARVARYYENLRIVYKVEARVQQIRRAAAPSTPPEQQGRPRKQSPDSSGNSSSNNPGDAQHGLLAAEPVVTGPRIDAAVHLPPQRSNWMNAGTGDWVERAAGHTLATSFAPPFADQFALQPAPQASSCSLQTICSSRRYFFTRERRLA